MNSEWMLAWWNLIYIVPFFLALLYLVIYSVSGLTFGESGAEGDGEAGADAGAEAGPEADAGAGADHSLEADHSPEADHSLVHAGHSAEAHAILPQFLNILGVGRIPLSIVLMVLLFSWGVIGFVVNQLFRPVLPQGLAVLASFPLAGVGSLSFTRLVGSIMGRWLPTTETYVQRRSELVGVAGESMFDINQKFGMAAIRDRQGNFLQIPCRTYEDGRPIPKGKRVLLVDYDSNEKLFYVTETNL